MTMAGVWSELVTSDECARVGCGRDAVGVHGRPVEILWASSKARGMGVMALAGACCSSPAAAARCYEARKA